MTIKVGSLVKYVPSTSATFKWEKWHDGEVSEEWISYLEEYE